MDSHSDTNTLKCGECTDRDGYIDVICRKPHNAFAVFNIVFGCRPAQAEKPAIGLRQLFKILIIQCIGLNLFADRDYQKYRQG